MDGLNAPILGRISQSLAGPGAWRRASSLESNLAAERKARFFFEIDIGKSLPGAVTDFESHTNVLDSPGRREVAFSHGNDSK
jgi:hypothetical protein